MKKNRITDKDGYVLILMPSHPRANVDGRVYEHILQAEKALGKTLPTGAAVHHANGSKDNGPLVICQDEAYHQLLERRTRAFKACGHASWRKCWICKEYGNPANMAKHGQLISVNYKFSSTTIIFPVASPMMLPRNQPKAGE